MNFKKRVNGSWTDTPHYIHTTDTDTITTPADIYANDNNATVGLKGNMEQSGTPTPSSPIQPSECGDLETEGTKAGQYKIPILSANTTTPVYLGEVQSTRQIKKLVLDGTEDWSSTTNSVYIALANLGDIPTPVSNSPLVCTHLPNNTSGMTQGGNWYFRSYYTASVQDWKTYLAQQYAAGTPVCVWYVLATPETAVVNEPIRKIGDYADEVSGISIPTIAGANTLSVGTTLQPSEVTATYKGWHEASEIVHRYQYGEWDGSPPPTYPVYGFKIDKNNDDPDTRVTYLYDAEGMTPAYMDFSNGTFNYGSWANAWFIKNNRPVALKFDGIVDYELNHTDFTKKLDGTASDVEDANYAGNFMSEMPTVYVKRWEDNDYNYMAFCEIPYDEDFLAQAHTNANGTVNNAIYLPMFKGSVDNNNKMRSLMGTYPRRKTTGTNEVDYAGNCGTGWQIWDKAKIDLIMDLIVLITKSTNCKGKIGIGDCYTYNYRDTINYGGMKSGYETDITTHSTNAQFYGSEGTEIANYGKHHMCAFYIEDLWGNRADRCLGFNLVDNIYKVKMTPPYALETNDTYETLITTPLISPYGWLLNISSSNLYGSIPTGDTAANGTRGFCSYWYKQNRGNRLSTFGGTCNDKMAAGRYWSLYVGHDLSSWDIGASPCYSNPT